MIVGNNLLQENIIVQEGYLPFYWGFHSYHRATSLDFDVKKIFVPRIKKCETLHYYFSKDN